MGAHAAPLEVYGRLPFLEQVQISPDGTELAFVATTEDTRRVLVKRLTDGKMLVGVNAAKTKLRDLQWADNNHLLITTSTTTAVAGLEGGAEEWYLLNALDVTSAKLSGMMQGVPDAMNVIEGEPLIRRVGGKAVVFSSGQNFVNSYGTISLFRSDPAGGHTSLVQQGTPDTDGWMVGADGEVIAESRYDQPHGRWTLRVRDASGHWRLSKTIDAPIERPSIEGLGRDGKSVLVWVWENETSILHEVPLDGGPWGEAMPDPYDGLIFDATTHALIGAMRLDKDELNYTFFDPASDHAWKLIQRAFPHERVELMSWTANRRKIVVKVTGQNDGYAYALVDMDAKKADWIGDIYADLPDAEVVQPTPFSYKAADGLEIPAYLTLPKGKPAKALPLIVLPHGGPESRDDTDFDWLREALVSRGYAVLQPNFRGSSGYGWDFVQAGFGQWGRKMQTDLSDGVRDLVAKGTVDPKRVCIFGGSYGGYAALAGAALDKGVYRCAVDLAGISDIRRMLNWVQSEHRSSKNDTQRYWDRFMGAKGPDDHDMDLISPADQAAKVEIPILIIHGKDDTVVPYEQSQVMADALKRNNKPFTMVTLKHEDHWLSKSDTRLQAITAAVAFLEANNPPN
ncbi:MAG: S9 family peptidase [Caulobacteraceae bacterium]|nr:S9 family peptidase [Caulobacteraceae bacterium]